MIESGMGILPMFSITTGGTPVPLQVTNLKQ